MRSRRSAASSRASAMASRSSAMRALRSAAERRSSTVTKRKAIDRKKSLHRSREAPARGAYATYRASGDVVPRLAGDGRGDHECGIAGEDQATEPGRQQSTVRAGGVAELEQAGRRSARGPATEGRKSLI